MKKPDLHSVAASPGSEVSPAAEENLSIQRLQAGASEEYRALIERYKSRIFSLVYRQLGDLTEAEDLTQEIFVKAFMNINKFRFESTFSTWLISIAFNHLNSYFSSKDKRQRNHNVPLELVREEAGASDPAEVHEQKKFIERMRAALSGITPKLRAAFVLVALDGRSYEEAAGMLEIPVGTVRSRVNQARVLLRAEMERFR